MLNILIKLLRKLWKFFLNTFVFNNEVQSKEYYRNRFGSIISPLEFRLQWDRDLTSRALEVAKFIKVPVYADKPYVELSRIGSRGDGGYFLPDYWTDSTFAISGGISNNNDFELNLAKSGIPVLQFDHSIEIPPNTGENLYFKKERMGSGGISLIQAFDMVREDITSSQGFGLLKLDIEGSELQLLEESPSTLLAQFSIIVIEFHYIGSIYQDKFWNSFSNVIRKLQLTHRTGTILGNNSRPIVQIGGIAFPDIFEMTLVRIGDENNYIFKEAERTSQISDRASLYVN
jgi:hypothetical protein